MTAAAADIPAAGPPPARRLLDRQMTEDELLEAVTHCARLYGWHVAHLRDSRTSNAVGLPDLVLARDGQVLLRELKNERAKVTDDQAAWLYASGGKVWRPRDWSTGRILAELAP